MLTNNMKESKDNFVNVPDYGSGLMSEVLRFIYCNKVENLTAIAHKLNYAAEKYQLDGLKELCLEKIILSLSSENVLKSLVIANRVSNAKDLSDHCINHIISFNLNEALPASKEWKDLPQDIVTRIVREMAKRHFVQELTT